MLAIVSKTQEATGEKIYLLGMGGSELQARQAAYAYCNHPAHHPFDEEEVFWGGHLLTVSDRLDDLYRAAQWTGHYDENGQHVGEDNTEAHGMLMLALGRLCINAQGDLDYTNLVVAPRPTYTATFPEKWDDSEAYDYV